MACGLRLWLARCDIGPIFVAEATCPESNTINSKLRDDGDDPNPSPWRPSVRIRCSLIRSGKSCWRAMQSLCLLLLLFCVPVCLNPDCAPNPGGWLR